MFTTSLTGLGLQQQYQQQTHKDATLTSTRTLWTYFRKILSHTKCSFYNIILNKKPFWNCCIEWIKIMIFMWASNKKQSTILYSFNFLWNISKKLPKCIFLWKMDLTDKLLAQCSNYNIIWRTIKISVVLVNQKNGLYVCKMSYLKYYINLKQFYNILARLKAKIHLKQVTFSKSYNL